MPLNILTRKFFHIDRFPGNASWVNDRREESMAGSPLSKSIPSWCLPGNIVLQPKNSWAQWHGKKRWVLESCRFLQVSVHFVRLSLDSKATTVLMKSNERTLFNSTCFKFFFKSKWQRFSPPTS